MSTIPTLELVRERKISELLPGSKPKTRWEASGILVRDGFYYVVFDDRTEFARIASDLEPGSDNGLFGMADDVTGFEGITYNSVKRRYYLLVEAREDADESYRAVLVEYNDEFSHIKSRSLDFPFKSDNKGFEAVTFVRRNEQDFVLALCEGNKCKSGKKGREPGGGRVQLFEKKKKLWQHVATIALPTTVPFVDYSGMSIDNGRVAIVSQVNSMLWVGQFDESDWTWRDDGQLYSFPRSEDDSILYGNIEGVGWISPTRIVAVSDRSKKSEQPEEHSEKDQSVHIFDIPS